MDYYTYQQQFVDNLNEFISEQFTYPSSPASNESFNYPYVDNQVYPSYDPVLPQPTYDSPIPSSYKYNFHPTHDLQLSSPPTQTPEIKTDDELWIETWLSKIGKIQINLNSTVEIKHTNPVKEPVKPPKCDIQIHSVKTSLKNCFRVLDELQGMQEALKTNVSRMSTTEWTGKAKEIGIVKENFSKLFAQFERPEFVTQLRLVVEKRKKKRLAQKRRKQNNVIRVSEMMENRQKLHKEIDCWLEAMKDEVERAKIEENMKKEADCVLAEVTKKKSDGRKLLSLISSLMKLRYVREQAAIQRGEQVSLEDAGAFMKATDRLNKIWTDALGVYGKEEQGLRMMLEETAVEDNNAARIARERKITQEWDVALFGPKRMPSAAYWGLMAAEKDLETFIAIRKSWDTFLVGENNQNGSKIPIGWVTPNSNPQQSWIKYLDAF